jgi:hypothetical protein
MLYFVVTRNGVSDSLFSCNCEDHAASIASSICWYFHKMTPEKRQNDEMFIFDIQSLFLRWGNLSWQQDVEQS